MELKNGLKRQLGLVTVINIVIANMIGTGIFTTSGLLMLNLHNPMLMIGLWAAAGVIALCGALCYGELGAAYPKPGGEYVFLTELFHPLFGFLTGWVSFIVGFAAPIAAATIGFSEYMVRAFPIIDEWAVRSGIGLVVIKKLLSLAVLVFFTMVHLRGMKFGTKVQNGLTTLKIVFIVGLLLSGFLLGHGSMSHFHYDSPVQAAPDWKTIGLAIMWILFAYSGWNASTYIGSEIKDPKKNVPRSLLLGTVLVMVLYVALNCLYVYAVSPEEMKGVISIGGLAVGNLFGPVWERGFSFMIGLALFSSISAYILLGPRIYFAMARDGRFFGFAGKAHPKTHVPSRSILIQSALAGLMILTGTFDQILTYMGFSLGIFPIMAVLCVFKLRRKEGSPRLIPLYPIPPILYSASGILILILAFMARPVESSVAIGVILVGVPAYTLFIWKKNPSDKHSPRTYESESLKEAAHEK